MSATRFGKYDPAAKKEVGMPDVKYEVVEHDGGWAYTVNGTFSETFPSHGAALAAAQNAAGEQTIGDKTTEIVYQDAEGMVHQEIAERDDRPPTRVVDMT
jgi:hypothetical protein